MGSHESFEGHAAEYVLAALGPEEAASFEDHLAACPICRNDVADFQEVATTLADAVKPLQPPAALRARVLAAVRAGSNDHAPAEAIPIAIAAAPRADRVPFGWKTLAAVAAVVVVALAGLAYEVLQLNRQIDRDEALLSYSYAALSIMAGADERWQVSGTSQAPNVHGVLAYSRDAEAASLVLWNLPHENGERYRVWTAGDGDRVPVGAMWAQDDGLWIIIPEDIGTADRVGVTMTTPGSDTPVDVVDSPISLP